MAVLALFTNLDGEEVFGFACSSKQEALSIQDVLSPFVALSIEPTDEDAVEDYAEWLAFVSVVDEEGDNDMDLFDETDIVNEG